MISSRAGKKLKIYAFLVEFQSDQSEFTTGDGKFGSGSKIADYRLDPGQSDNRGIYYRNYIERHLEFVHNYYKKVSDGKLDIEYQVIKYLSELPKQMTYYRDWNKKSRESCLEYGARLGVGYLEFVRDAVKALDGNPDIDTIPTDDASLVLIVHAGHSGLIDGQGFGAAEFANTPSDFIDSYISPEDFVLPELWPQYFGSLKFDTLTVNGRLDSGISVTKGIPHKLINELMVVSETAHQDGIIFGINGIIVNQVARMLGLPDLFNTAVDPKDPCGGAKPAIGAFGLMDFAGYNSGYGFVPPYPSAWSRIFLGWTEPTIYKPGASVDSLRVFAANLDTNDEIIMIPINEFEYFLAENRQRSLNDSITIVYKYGSVFNDSDSVRIHVDSAYSFFVDSVFNGDSLIATEYKKNKIGGIIVRCSDYDMGLPGSGLLIWHIDELILQAVYKYNLVNFNMNRRGVDMEEADGIEDIGLTFTNIIGWRAYDYGGPNDMFPNYSLKNKKLYSSFTPFTELSTSHSNSGGMTHLYIEDIRTSGLHADMDMTEYLACARDPNCKYENYPKITITHNTFMGDTIISSRIDSFITFKLSWKFTQGSFPRFTDSLGFVYSPFILENSGKKFIVQPSASGRILGYSDMGTNIGKPESTVFIYSGIDKKKSGDSIITVIDTFKIDTFEVSTLYRPDSILDSLDSNSTVNDFSKLDSSTIIGFDTLGNLLKFSLNSGFDSMIKSTVTFNTNSPVGGKSFSNLAVLSKDTILFGTDSGYLYICVIDENNGNKIHSSLKLDHHPINLVAVSDVNNHNRRTIAATDSQTLYILSLSNQDFSIASRKSFKLTLPHSIAVGNIDGKINDKDMSQEIILRYIDTLTNCDSLWVFNDKGNIMPGWPRKVSGWENDTSVSLNPGISLGDLNSDGSAEIVVSTQHRIYSLDYQGNNISGWPYIYLPTDSVGGWWSVYDTIDSVSRPLSWAATPLIYDIDNNGTQEVIVGQGNGNINILEGNGKRRTFSIGNNEFSNPFSTGALIIHMLIQDMDGDGELELAAMNSNSFLYAWKIPGSRAGGTSHWPVEGGSMGRTFAFSNSNLGNPVLASEPINIGYFFNYPNPTSLNPDKNITNFKFLLNKTADKACIKIFNVAGELAGEITIKHTKERENEIRDFNISSFSPGVYFIKIEASDQNGNKAHKFSKMAVLK
ncbi:MAG: T9SS type A sorting domain-containing protein [bacterium]